MYCSNCGAKASGNFCSGCGSRLSPPASAQADHRSRGSDWEQEVDPKAVLEAPEVRELVERNAARPDKPIAGEEYMKLFDKLAILPLPSGTFVSLVQPMYAKLGIKTGKTRTEQLPAPPGRVLASLFCALARKGRKVLDMERANDGCVVTADLPSDLWTLAGKLVVAVERAPAGTRVQAATAIPGQYFDWGKSARCLNELIEDLSKPPR
jgi:hypothetical protein